MPEQVLADMTPYEANLNISRAMDPLACWNVDWGKWKNLGRLIEWAREQVSWTIPLKKHCTAYVDLASYQIRHDCPADAIADELRDDFLWDTTTSADGIASRIRCIVAEAIPENVPKERAKGTKP